MIDFVNDSDVKPALYLVAPAGLEIVAKKIEAELPHGAVDDVLPVVVPPLAVVHVPDHRADTDAQRLVDRGEKLGIPGSQVFVGGDHVDGPAQNGLQHRRQRAGDGLAFPRVHLNNAAVKQVHSGQQLLVGGPESQQVGVGKAQGCLIKVPPQENFPRSFYLHLSRNPRHCRNDGGFVYAQTGRFTQARVRGGKVPVLIEPLTLKVFFENPPDPKPAIHHFRNDSGHSGQDFLGPIVPRLVSQIRKSVLKSLV